MDGLKRGSAAIVGAAESDLGQVADGMSPMDLCAQGIQRALADCGLALKDIDGLLMCPNNMAGAGSGSSASWGWTTSACVTPAFWRWTSPSAPSTT